MSRSSNSLKTSDVITTPIKLVYTSSYDCSTLAEYGMEVLSGVNGPVTITGSIPQETLNYWSTRHLYYSNYLTGSFPVSASSADNFLQSTAASGSLDSDNRYFPTESNARITILSIPRGVFGEKIAKSNFILSSSAYYIIDDGNGNLVDQASGSLHVGNIIYPQGMVIFTNPNYLDILPCPTGSTTTTTSTTSTTTTAVPTTTTTSTTSTTTTAAPTTTTTSTTTSTTTEVPTTTTTSTTTSTTTAEPTTTTTSTTTSTTTCAPQNAQSMYYNYDTGLPTMFGTGSAEAACNLSVSASTIYYNTSLALTTGTPLYYDECLTVPITASAYTDTPQQYFKIGPYYVNFETDGYTVRSVTACPTPTTTTTTSTTTSTTTVTYTYYAVDRYTCDSPSGPCTFAESTFIANTSSGLTLGNYYLDVPSGNIYNITSTTSSGAYFITYLSGAGTANCSVLCSA